MSGTASDERRRLLIERTGEDRWTITASDVGAAQVTTQVN